MNISKIKMKIDFFDDNLSAHADGTSSHGGKAS